jgi:hypothetical protein
LIGKYVANTVYVDCETDIEIVGDTIGYKKSIPHDEKANESKIRQYNY